MNHSDFLNWSIDCSQPRTGQTLDGGKKERCYPPGSPRKRHGGRLLKSWLLAPLMAMPDIDCRLDAIESIERDVEIHGGLKTSY